MTRQAIWGAHSFRVLVSAFRRNELPRRVGTEFANEHRADAR